MKTYNIFQALVLSFFSADFYAAVARRWRGIGFWYLFLLVLLATLPGAIHFWIMTSQVDQEMLAPATAQVPRIEIVNGEAKVDAPQPILIKDPDTGKVIFIIDTTGKTTLDNVELGFMLTKDAIIMKNQNKVEDYKLHQLEPLLGNPVVIDRKWVEDTIFWWIDLLNVIVLPVVAVFCFIYRFIQLLILGLIGLLLASSRQPALSYAQSLRLSAMALTPIIVINAIYEQLMPSHGLWWVWWVICIALPIAYLNFGIRAFYERRSPEDEQLQDSQDPRDDDLFFEYERRKKDSP